MLIKCEDCGHEMSDKAKACPNCGCPNPKMKERTSKIVRIPTIEPYDSTRPIVTIPFL